MKTVDALIALTEAIRLARLELACYQDSECRGTPEWTLKRLDELLRNKDIDAAMNAIDPNAESPSIVPHNAERQRTASKQ